MNYALIRKCDIANGEGVRVTLFVSGCVHRCKNCFQPELWDFTYGTEFDDVAEENVILACRASYISGLTLLGGDPMMPSNQVGLIGLLRKFRNEFGKRKTIWCYTGCILEDLKDASSKYHTPVTDEMLSYVDVLVDGPFVEELKDPSLAFRGSSNQRIILNPGGR